MAVSDEVKLRVYNDALRILGSRRLASLTEARDPRRHLDDAYGPAGEGVRYCLEAADWNFATRTVEAAYDPGVEPGFGFRRAFARPDDFVRLTSLSRDGYFVEPMTARHYTDEAGYWLADCDTLYIRYVSDADAFGFDSGKWSIAFRKFLAGFLAFECCERITNSTDNLQVAKRIMDDARTHAKSRDAMDEGTKFMPPGSWVMSRGSNMRDWKAR